MTLNPSELLRALKQIHFETFYGHIAMLHGRGMPSPAPEAYFSFLRAKPSRLRFQLCKILKPDFKHSRIPVGSQELLVLK